MKNKKKPLAAGGKGMRKIAFVLALMFILIPALTVRAAYDGTEGSSSGATGAVSGGPTSSKTGLLVYVINKQERGKVSEYGIISPVDLDFSGYATYLKPRYDWIQQMQSYQVYPDMPFPLKGKLSPNGLAVRQWLEHKDAQGTEFYWYVLRDLFGIDFTRSVRANAEDYVIIIEPFAWYKSPNFGKLGGTANGLARWYEVLGDVEGKKDSKVSRVAFESEVL